MLAHWLDLVSAEGWIAREQASILTRSGPPARYYHPTMKKRWKFLLGSAFKGTSLQIRQGTQTKCFH